MDKDQCGAPNFLIFDRGREIFSRQFSMKRLPPPKIWCQQTDKQKKERKTKHPGNIICSIKNHISSSLLMIKRLLHYFFYLPCGAPKCSGPLDFVHPVHPIATPLNTCETWYRTKFVCHVCLRSMGDRHTFNGCATPSASRISLLSPLLLWHHSCISWIVLLD